LRAQRWQGGHVLTTTTAFFRCPPTDVSPSDMQNRIEINTNKIVSREPVALGSLNSWLLSAKCVRDVRKLINLIEIIGFPTPFLCCWIALVPGRQNAFCYVHKISVVQGMKAAEGGRDPSPEDPKYDTSYQHAATGTRGRTPTPSSSAGGRNELYVIAVNGTVPCPSAALPYAGIERVRYTENRMKEVGLAIMDLRKPELLLTQFTDSKRYSLTTSKLARSPHLPWRASLTHPV
jgi:hypothetical protein